MYAVKGVLNAAQAASGAVGVRSSLSKQSGGTMGDDKSVSTVNSVSGAEVVRRTNERYVSEAISVGQDVAEKISSIEEILKAMRSVAEAVADGDYETDDLSAIQDEFSSLAEQINAIVESTEYNGNKLLSSQGGEISFSIGGNSTMEISSQDLGFDVTGLDLAASAVNALTAVEDKLREVQFYGEQLASRTERLDEVSETIELERRRDFGIDEDGLDVEQAKALAVEASEKATEEIAEFFDIEPGKASVLLRDVLGGAKSPVNSGMPKNTTEETEQPEDNK